MTTASEKHKLSKTPSWIMVGFALGVLTMLGLQTEEKKETAPSEPKPAVETAPVAAEHNVSALENKPSLVAVEAVFANYRELAFWDHDMTEVALWNSSSNTFADHFEVLRTSAGVLYFRSIPAFTRLPLDNYGPPNCPLRFTETAAMRAERQTRAANPLPPPSLEPLQFPALPPPEPRPERP
jgi:hypothetical protein